MIPIRDNNPTHGTPRITIGLIVVNCAVFLLSNFQPDGGERAVWKYGYLPAGLMNDRAAVHAALVHRERSAAPRLSIDRRGRVVMVQSESHADAATALPAAVKLLTCMFMHGSWMHLIGNMLYLWIFGNNIEDRLGHFGFSAFYLVTGVAGTLAHTFIDPDGLVPLVGASGAISGVLGAYLLLFPHARVVTLVPIGFVLTTVMLPAWVFLGLYALLQVLNGLPALTRVAVGGVAYWAHIGGFAAGIGLIKLMPQRRRAPWARAAARRYADDDDVDFGL